MINIILCARSEKRVSINSQMLVKVKLKVTNVSFVTEVSEHIFFNDRYFRYDVIYLTLRALLNTILKLVTRFEDFRIYKFMRFLF